MLSGAAFLVEGEASAKSEVALFWATAKKEEEEEESAAARRRAAARRHIIVK